MEEEEKSLGEYLDIIRRHKYLVLATIFIFTILSAAVAYLLPASYKSEGLILIESQEIPRDLVKSTVTSYAAQRIEVIKQRAMTTTNVMKMVDKFNLYADMRKKAPPSEMVVLFRKNVGLEMVEANVTDPNSGRQKRATIAFTVSFLDRSPGIAQKVANALVTEFLDENVKNRTNRAIETTAFLNEEANKFQRKIQKLEGKVAEFKDKYSDSLPELLQFNLSTIERLQEELVSNQNQVMQLKDQIASMSFDQNNLQYYLNPAAGVQQGLSGNINTDLVAAEAELSRLQTRYSSSHPDVIQLKRRVQTLRAELGVTENTTNVREELSLAKKELSSLKQRYADSHPDVKSLVNRVAVLQGKADSPRANSTPRIKSTTNKTNPIYLQLASKINLAQREISRLRGREAAIREKMTVYEARVVQTHQVQREYEDLTRDHANNLAKYQELKSKQLEAELAQNLESENKGESFTLIEPPSVPSKSEKPNREKIFALGVIASVMLGFGLALILEMIKGGVRGYSAITRVVGQVPLVVVPMIHTENDLKSRTDRKKWIVSGIIIAIILGIIGFHLFVMDLEVFWFKVLRKLSLL
jgi:succinoglycan biosynthesis transport protein ExoP